MVEHGALHPELPVQPKHLFAIVLKYGGLCIQSLVGFDGKPQKRYNTQGA